MEADFTLFSEMKVTSASQLSQQHVAIISSIVRCAQMERMDYRLKSGLGK